MTEDGIDHQKARNIEWIFQAENLPETFPRPEVLGECLMFFEYMYLHTGQPILKIAQDTEQRFQIETGSGLRVFHSNMYERQYKFE